ncbi:hypothetical protein [Streptomyces sp. TP-A0356]|uniref:hypothetical protein n=1 Tax=Streptomyces sp. TP-A0356 TaxID=1359208 RepID=UPI0006E37330|nr:hypothetical protein [Streptomyces sp. TP-A0356]
MREKPDVGTEGEDGKGTRRKRLDLNVPQVAGGAVAAVVAAKLASYFGVYGTILGAGLVSVVATCGGSVFQHVFRRTGEQIREATVPAGPRGPRPPAPGEFSEGTVHRARFRGWRRPVLAAALVFGVTMAGITAYELASGNGFGGAANTTVGDALTGHSTSSSRSDTSPSSARTPSTGVPTPSDGASPQGTPSGDTGASAGSGDIGTAGSPAPGLTPGRDTGSPGGAPASPPAPSASATSPAPDAGSRSRTADPGRGGPSGQ